MGAAAWCSTFQCSAFRVASEGKWLVSGGQWSDKSKTGINTELAENTPNRSRQGRDLRSGQAPFTETEPEEASNRLERENREGSWLAKLFLLPCFSDEECGMP